MMDTPEGPARRKSTTPPAGHALQRWLKEEVDAAVSEKSVELLGMVLSRHHPCGEEHCLWEAVRCEVPSAVELLLQARPEDVDAGCGGWRPLHVALQSCSVVGDTGYVMAKMLLEHGASPDACSGDPPPVGSPLHVAAKRGSLAGLELLLAYGADPGVVDASGLAPLHVICSQVPFHGVAYTRKLIGTMLKGGARPFQSDESGREPAEHLAGGGGQELRGLLARAGQQWHRRSLRLLAGAKIQSQASRGVHSVGRGGEALGWGSLLPEVLEDVARFF